MVKNFNSYLSLNYETSQSQCLNFLSNLLLNAKAMNPIVANPEERTMVSNQLNPSKRPMNGTKEVTLLLTANAK